MDFTELKNKFKREELTSKTLILQTISCVIYFLGLTLSLAAMGSFAQIYNEIFMRSCILFRGASSSSNNSACLFVIWGQAIISLMSIVLLTIGVLKIVLGLIRNMILLIADIILSIISMVFGVISTIVLTAGTIVTCTYNINDSTDYNNCINTTRTIGPIVCAWIATVLLGISLKFTIIKIIIFRKEKSSSLS